MKNNYQKILDNPLARDTLEKNEKLVESIGSFKEKDLTEQEISQVIEGIENSLPSFKEEVERLKKNKVRLQKQNNLAYILGAQDNLKEIKKVEAYSAMYEIGMATVHYSEKCLRYFKKKKKKISNPCLVSRLKEKLIFN